MFRTDSSDDKTVTLTINNLNDNFEDGYYAIVYLCGGGSVGSITDGTSTYYFKIDGAPASVTPVLITQISDLGTGNLIANYAVFGSASSALTADSISFTLSDPFVGIGGVQIMAIPEPATLGLIAFSGYAEDKWLDVIIDRGSRVRSG